MVLKYDHHENNDFTEIFIRLTEWLKNSHSFIYCLIKWYQVFLIMISPFLMCIMKTLKNCHLTIIVNTQTVAEHSSRIENTAIIMFSYLFSQGASMKSNWNSNFLEKCFSQSFANGLSEMNQLEI